MAISNEKFKEYNKRLLLSRMRVLLNHGFYGLLLMHMSLAVDEKCETAATDGYRIYFGTDFLHSLSDSELDFVMMHETLHAALRHCLRGDKKDSGVFNTACDIVVNSNILYANNMDLTSISIGGHPLIHKTPKNDEGYEYTAEEVYEMLEGSSKRQKSGNGNGYGIITVGYASENDDKNKSSGFGLGRSKQEIGKKGENACWDDHSLWTVEETDSRLRNVWVKRTVDAANAIEIREASASRGILPLFAKRMLKELKEPQTDWRTILSDFIQEDVCDYSFSPPDKRFDDSPFFLPDFNGTEISVSDILFMIDTSSSMSDEMITAAYSEVKGAIDQFDGKLRGWLGFFDAAVIEPKPFENEDEFKIIYPSGGGGTDFQIIFEYVMIRMCDALPKCIIILTDGYAPFPNVSVSGGIPVLWLLNNDNVKPPWGKTARIKI